MLLRTTADFWWRCRLWNANMPWQISDENNSVQTLSACLPVLFTSVFHPPPPFPLFFFFFWSSPLLTNSPNSQNHLASLCWGPKEWIFKESNSSVTTRINSISEVLWTNRGSLLLVWPMSSLDWCHTQEDVTLSPCLPVAHQKTQEKHSPNWQIRESLDVPPMSTLKERQTHFLLS